MVVEGAPPDLEQPGRPFNILSGIAHQAAIAIENVTLIRQLAARERLEQEVKLAREIQMSFLPKHCPDVPGWDLATFWQAARQVGGDFYDFIPLPREHFALVIADVADKGVGAAMFMALCRTLVRSATINSHRTPAEALARTNEFILMDTASDLFVTMVMADLSPVGKVTYANAGHNPPMVVHISNPHPQVQYLTEHGIALGLINPVNLDDHAIKLEEGDVLVLYTDGVTDALNAKGEEFGLERLEACVQQHMRREAGEIVQAIQDSISQFVGGEPPFDDLTLVVAKRMI
jgi:sigma-B regulation protein RsbU (phosphoserine phosphatase)